MTIINKTIKIKNKNFVLNFKCILNNNKTKFNTVKIDFGWLDTSFGRALIMKNASGLCGLAFTAEFGQEVVLDDMKKRWPNSSFFENFEAVKEYCKIVQSGSGELYLDLIGTSFQLKVWEELLIIPIGQTKPYSEISANIGFPKATRAVATAVGYNPISWLIPCHRAVRKSGMLGGYHWGISIKEKMLNYEKFHF